MSGVRLTLGSGTSAGAADTTPRTGTATATVQHANSGKPTSVLVHGAFADSPSWKDVQP